MFANIGLNKYTRKMIKITKNLKHCLCLLFLKLSTYKRREIISYLKVVNQGSDISLPDIVTEIRKKCYICMECEKIFTNLSSAALHCIHDKEKFFHKSVEEIFYLSDEK